MLSGVESLSVESIRLDGGTQTREALDQSYVDEIADAFSDAREVAPVVVMRDADGVVWLVDGFHRVAAAKKLGRQRIQCRVREGSVEDARFAAAGCNVANGLRRTDGDKRRAVEMLRKTPKGAAMLPKDAARHIGISLSWFYEVDPIGKGRVSSPERNEKYLPTAPPSSARRPSKYDDVRPAIEAALKADPIGTKNSDVARDLAVDEQFVRKVRIDLGLPRASMQKPEGERAEQVVREHPDWTIERQAVEAGVSKKTICLARKKLGADDVTAPASKPKREDPRDAVEVLRARPVGDAVAVVVATLPQSPPKVETGRVAEALRAVEKMTDEERERFVECVMRRWPALKGAIS